MSDIVKVMQQQITAKVAPKIVIAPGGSYEGLTEKPCIGSKELQAGENLLDYLGLQEKGAYPEEELSNEEIFKIIKGGTKR